MQNRQSGFYGRGLDSSSELRNPVHFEFPHDEGGREEIDGFLEKDKRFATYFDLVPSAAKSLWNRRE